MTGVTNSPRNPLPLSSFLSIEAESPKSTQKIIKAALEPPTTAKVKKIVEETLALIPGDKDLIMDYLFQKMDMDLEKIYQQAGLHFNYIPKMQNQLTLSPHYRENRVRTGWDSILSRLLREGQWAQAAMEKEEDKSFEYAELDLPPDFVYKEEYTSFLLLPEQFIGCCHVGISSFIGHRNAMEDEYLVTRFTLVIRGDEYEVPLFGVFDGNGGGEASKFAKAHLSDILRNTLLEFNSDGLHIEGIWNALKITNVRLNAAFLSSGTDTNTVGSTVIFSILLHNMLFIANAGDCRPILNNGGVFMQLSEDIRPTTPRFEKSINNHGGIVQNGRLNTEKERNSNRGLGTGRGIGISLFEGAVSARPKIFMIPLDSIEPGSDLILLSDGVTDVSSTRQLLQADQDNRHKSPHHLAKNFVFSAYKAGSQDNLTAVVIRLSKLPKSPISLKKCEVIS
jgi:serine/threonine protein phosphatase PrpC